MKTLAPAKRAPQTVMTVSIYRNKFVTTQGIIANLFAHVLDVEDVLVPDCEDEEHGKDGAADEGHVPRQDSGQRGHEDVHVVGGGLIGAGQSHHQLVFEFVKMSAMVGNIKLKFLLCGCLT